MKTKHTTIAVVLAAVAVLCAAFATSAVAAPSWKFEGKALEGTESETILGGAYESSMTIPGLTTKCEDFLYKLTIENHEGAGSGEVTEVPLYNCTSDNEEGEEVCAVGSIGAEELPWPAHLATVSSSPYIVIEGVDVGIIYTGEECPLGEILVPVTGSAGGIISNAEETATFNAATLSATGTSLEALSTKIEWNGVFPTEAFEWHREEAISAS